MREVNSQWSIVNGQRKKILLILIVIHYSLFASAQRISSTVDKDRIAIGEQIEWQLKVEDVNKAIDVASWLNLPDTFNHFEILDRGKIDTIDINGSFTYLQKIHITSFDSGKWSLPVVQVLLSNKTTLSSQPSDITVSPVDVSKLQDYHDIKDILPIELHTDIRIIIALCVGFLISVILIIWLLKNRKNKRVVKVGKIPSTQDPYHWAMSQIDSLQQKNLLQSQQHKAFYTELITICRTYSDAVSHTDTSMQTTGEYMVSMKELLHGSVEQTNYFQLLRLSDAVKFAKYIPTDEESVTSLQTARSFIEMLYQKNKIR
jgi:hypothetical protein